MKWLKAVGTGPKEPSHSGEHEYLPVALLTPTLQVVQHRGDVAVGPEPTIDHPSDL
jgi:hypothetical protein